MYNLLSTCAASIVDIRKRLPYKVVSNCIMIQKLNTVQIQMEGEQLNVLSIQKEMPRNVLMNG